MWRQEPRLDLDPRPYDVLKRHYEEYRADKGEKPGLKTIEVMVLGERSGPDLVDDAYNGRRENDTAAIPISILLSTLSTLRKLSIISNDSPPI